MDLSQILKNKFWLLPLLLAFVVNVNTLWNQFVWDDIIFLDQQLPAFKTLSDIFFPNLGIYQISPGYYRPLIILSYVLDQKIWDGNPFGFHLTVLLFHVINVLLVFGLSRLLFKEHPKGDWIAVISSGLFAIHPVHTENIAWMAGRSDIIPACFMFLSLLCYIQYRSKQQKPSYLLLTSALSFLFALLSKETALSLILIFPLYDYLYRRPSPTPSNRHLKAYFFPYALFIFAVAVYFLLRVAALESTLGGNRWVDPSEKSLLFNFIAIIGFYIQKLLWPFNLQAFIPHLPQSLNHFLISVFLFLLSMALWVWAYLKKHLAIFFLFAWVFITLGPSLVVAFSSIPNVPVADRYLYIPSFGFSLLLGNLITHLLSGFFLRNTFPHRLPRIMGSLLSVLIFGSWAITSFQGNLNWRNNLSLWSDMIQKAPDHGLPHNNLAHAYQLAGRWDEAIEEFKLAAKLEYSPFGNSLASASLGNLYRLKGKFDRAEDVLMDSIRIYPNNSLAYYYRALLYRDRSEHRGIPRNQKDEYLEKTIQNFKKTIQLDQFFPEVHYDLGLTYLMMGKQTEAQKHFRKVLALSQDPKKEAVQNAKKLLRQE